MPTIDWVQQTVPGAGTLKKVVRGPDRWMAVGDNGVVLSSFDGVTWTSQTLSQNVNSCAYGNGLWVAVGRGDHIFTSTDGETWTQRTAGSGRILNDVAYGGGQWVTVGNNDTVITSSDGLTWITRTGSTSVSYGWSRCAYGNGRWVAVGEPADSASFDGRRGTSTDGGITWAAQDTASRFFNVTYANNLWVMVGRYGVRSTSTDGISWSTPVRPAIADLFGIAYGNGLWVAVGYSGSTLTSPDAITWSTQTPTTSLALNSVAYSDLQWIAVGANSTVLTALNQPPTAPVLLSPADGTALDRQQAQTFRWQFTDPNIGVGDTQSAYNFAYRLTGGTWSETGWITSPLAQHTVAAGTFSDNSYEWKVAAKDSHGETSPWSTAGFFSAAIQPPGPSITDPANGATISLALHTVDWSTPNQDAYQLQVLAADGTTVLYDTGQVNSTTARSREVAFPDNQTTRIIRVSVLYAGLWSPWSSVTVTVSYTPPPVPTLTATSVDVGAGVPSAIRVAVEDHTPVGDQPSVVAHDVWVRGGPEGEIRLAADLPASLPYLWHLPASGVGYEFRARAIGDNGTSSWSEWTVDVPVPSPLNALWADLVTNVPTTGDWVAAGTWRAVLLSQSL